MTELQVVVIVSVYAIAIIGMLFWQGRSFEHALRTSLDGLQKATDARLEVLNTRLDTLDRKVDGLARRDSD
jgi:hypothetical protein